MTRAYVTLEELREWGACKARYKHLLENIEWDDADEVCIPLDLILEVNEAADLYWAVMEATEWSDVGQAWHDVYKELGGLSVCTAGGGSWSFNCAQHECLEKLPKEKRARVNARAKKIIRGLER